MWGSTTVMLETRLRRVPTRTNSRRSTLINQIVVAATIEGRRHDLSSIVGRSGIVGRHSFTLPAAMANRLEVFVSQIYYRPGATWDCFSFMDFVMGFRGNTFRFPSRGGHRLAVASNNRTEHAKAYIMTRRGVPVHGVIGCDRSGMTLGVLGVKNNLMLASSGDLRRIYEGDELHEVQGVR